MKRQPRSSPRSGKTQRTVSIIGTGSYVPEKILTNADLSQHGRYRDEWITTRTGIKERRVAAKDEHTSDMATKAALNASSRPGFQPSEIDLILVATATPDMLFPGDGLLRAEKDRREKSRLPRYFRGLRRVSFRDRNRAAIHHLAHLRHRPRHRRGKTDLDHELDRSQYLRAFRRRRGRGRVAASRRRAWRHQHAHRQRRRVHRHLVHARRRLALPDHARECGQASGNHPHDRAKRFTSRPSPP